MIQKCPYCGETFAFLSGHLKHHGKTWGELIEEFPSYRRKPTQRIEKPVYFVTAKRGRR